MENELTTFLTRLIQNEENEGNGPLSVELAKLLDDKMLMKMPRMLADKVYRIYFDEYLDKSE